MGRPDSILDQFGELRNANFFVSICQHYQQTTGLICMKFSGKVWIDHDSILGQFRETVRCRDAQQVGGVCCAFAPKLVTEIVLMSIFVIK